MEVTFLVGMFLLNNNQLSSLCAEASELIRGMLTPDPKKRLTIEEVCSHWWVNEGYDVSCLVVADELARQTPVRLDLLLALAPCPKSSKSLVIDAENEDSSLSLSLAVSDLPYLTVKYRGTVLRGRELNIQY
jgi:serine/threonine protein kinase